MSESISPSAIRDARARAGMTQYEAGAAIMYSESGWRKWEIGQRVMHPALFDYFLIVTGQKSVKLVK